MSDHLKFEVLVYGAAVLATIAGLFADVDLQALLRSIAGVG